MKQSRDSRQRKNQEPKSTSPRDYTKGTEIYWILGVMAAVLLILLITPSVMRSFNTFEYQGLTFTKEKFSELTVYRYSYHFADMVGQQYLYNLYLREDPRKNTVPVSGKIGFVPEEDVYISVNSTGLSECSHSLRDVASLANFISNNLFTVKSGTPNYEESVQNNLRYVTCDTHQNSTVILLREGNETRIEQQGGCYTISAARCETLSAI